MGQLDSVFWGCSFWWCLFYIPRSCSFFFRFQCCTVSAPPPPLVSRMLAAPFHSNRTIEYAPTLPDSMGILPPAPLVSRAVECLDVAGAFPAPFPLPPPVSYVFGDATVFCPVSFLRGFVLACCPLPRTRLRIKTVLPQRLRDSYNPLAVACCTRPTSLLCTLHHVTAPKPTHGGGKATRTPTPHRSSS